VDQIVAALTHVLAENGRHLRHMQPDEKITLTAQFAPAAASTNASPADTDSQESPPAEPEASDRTPSQPHNRELAGDLLLKQGKYAEAERAYMEAYQEQLKTHPAQSHNKLLGKAFSAAITRKAAESNAAGVSDDVFLRRVYLDLIGQPPTAKEIEDFRAERSPDKRTKLIEKLLQSPDYATNWVNRWQDVFAPGDESPQPGDDPHAAGEPHAQQIAGAIDHMILQRLHQITPAPAAPLPGRISVTATKRQMDALAAGALQRAEFEKQMVVQVFDPAQDAK
jgi:hypothetical protein